MTTKPPAKKLSTAQKHVLGLAMQGHDLYIDCKALSDFGGRRQTLNALRKLGLLWSDGTLTEAGKELMGCRELRKA